MSPDAATFLDRVVCDGRFVHEVQGDPRRVARALGVHLTDPQVQELSLRPMPVLVSTAFVARFGTRPEGPMWLSPDVGILIGIVLVAFGVVVWIIVQGKDKMRSSTDHSPYADQKL